MLGIKRVSKTGKTYYAYPKYYKKWGKENEDHVREYQTNRQRCVRKERRARYLKGKVCVGCGTSRDLRFHHKDPATKISHRIWRRSIEFIEAELAKCESVCRKCHKQRHKDLKAA